MSTMNGVVLKNMTYNGQKVKKWKHNGVQIFSAGSIVTYIVDTTTSFREEVDSGASCLSPTTYTPTKTGWTFVGWREDTTASGSVLTSKVMGDEPITLYAVYSQTITLSTVSNGSTAKTYGTRYYNAAGNIKNPTFTVASPTRSGWTFKGWSTSESSTAIAAASINKLELSYSTTRYAVWNCADVSGTTTFEHPNTLSSITGTQTLDTILSGIDVGKYCAVKLNIAHENYLQIQNTWRGNQLNVYISDGTNKTLIGYSYVDWTGESGVAYPNLGKVLTPTLAFANSSGTSNVYLVGECHAYGNPSQESSTDYQLYVYLTSYTLLGRTVVY